ncbi:MAG TPA: MEDS domain-containing protein [Micromonosporaceae bacterium]|nr:MEDS domain-containing protein [Micromonosporaceae bacterium]
MGGSFVVDGLQLGDHACWIYDDEDRCLREMARFVQVGLAQRQRVLYLTDSLAPSSLLVALQARGVLAAEAAATGGLVVRPAREVYLTGDRSGATVDPARLLRLTHDAVTEAVRAGYAGLRAVGEMTGALAGPSDVGRLIEYETRVNRNFLDGLAVGVCLYDARRFDGDLLRALAATHPCTRRCPRAPGADDGWRPPLRMRVDRAGLWLRGAVDATNRAALWAALCGFLDRAGGAGGPLRVDVSELTFLDAAAASLLARAAAAAPSGLTVTGCSDRVVRILALIGASGVPELTLERVLTPPALA